MRLAGASLSSLVTCYLEWGASRIPPQQVLCYGIKEWGRKGLGDADGQQVVRGPLSQPISHHGPLHERLGISFASDLLRMVFRTRFRISLFHPQPECLPGRGGNDAFHSKNHPPNAQPFWFGKYLFFLPKLNLGWKSSAFGEISPENSFHHLKIARQ